MTFVNATKYRALRGSVIMVVLILTCNALLAGAKIEKPRPKPSPKSPDVATPMERCRNGHGEVAIAACSEVLKIKSRSALAYYYRGIAWRFSGSTDKALEDFEKAIQINHLFWQAYNETGKTYYLQKNYQEAISSFSEALSIHETDDSYTLRGETWMQIGEANSAASDFKSALKLNPSNQRAKSGLSVALSPALPPLTAKRKTEPTTNSSPPVQEERVKMVKSGGVYTVPVEVNGVVTLHFIVDSGASDVTIPDDVVSTLMRTGTLDASQFNGTQQYQIADGSKVEGRLFTLSSLKVGNVRINSVRGSSADAKGALLLGQSFLENFESWSVDNIRHELVLVTK